MTTFAQIIMSARQIGQLTAAEMDYSLANPDITGYRAHRALDMAIGVVAGDGDYEATKARFAADITAKAAEAKTKKYTGWSDYSRGGIRYADA